MLLVDWMRAKKKSNDLIKWLREHKNTLPLKKYNKIKQLTKQTRIEAQQHIKDCFVKKHELHCKLEQIRHEYQSNNNNYKIAQIETIKNIINNNLTDEQKAVLDTIKHKHISILLN